MGFYDILCSPDSLLSVLIDPEEAITQDSLLLQQLISDAMADVVLVGGSTLEVDIIDETLMRLKEITSVPIVLFPGNPLQLSPLADALLLPVLISGRNPEYLIGHHVKAALTIKNLDLEVIPIGYILISDQSESSTSVVTQTEPIHSQNAEEIISTAIAGELIGMRAIYLEAGSGAQETVSPSVIASVKENINIPLIVGGGINTVQKYNRTLASNPNMVVIGNALEKQPMLLKSLRKAQQSHNNVNESRHYNKIYR